MRNNRLLWATMGLCIALSARAENTKAPSTIAENKAIKTAKVQGRFIPPKNQTLLFIGQDSDSIGDYISSMPQDNIEGITLYSSLKNSDPAQTLPGIHKVANWGSGDVSFQKTLKQAPNAALAIGLAFDGCNDTTHETLIASGKYNASIKQLVTSLKALAPRKIFLRIGYEFDGPWNCYSPSDYKAAYRNIAMAFKTAKADNVITVWQSAAWPDPAIAGDKRAIYDFQTPSHLKNWYPGDDVVDWIGMSVFYRDLSQWNYTPPYTPQFAQEQVLAFARAAQKPVMIAEAAPQGYHIANMTQSPIQMNKAAPTSQEDIWRNWYEKLFQFVDKNRDTIKALAYINAHWSEQAMWTCHPNIQAGQEGCANGNWGDTRVQANDYIKRLWLTEINHAQRWVQTGTY